MGHSSDDRSSAVEAVLTAPVSDDVLALAASAGIGRGSSSGRSCSSRSSWYRQRSMSSSHLLAPESFFFFLAELIDSSSAS